MTPGDFVARQTHVGDICYLCEKPIKEGDAVRYYGGDFIMHSSCIDKLINH